MPSLKYYRISDNKSNQKNNKSRSLPHIRKVNHKGKKLYYIYNVYLYRKS